MFSSYALCPQSMLITIIMTVTVLFTTTLLQHSLPDCSVNVINSFFYIPLYLFLQVYIEINGEPTDLHMKLGPHGEAFFVQEVLEQWEVCKHQVILTSITAIYRSVSWAIMMVSTLLLSYQGPDYLATSPIIPSPLKQAVNADRSSIRKRNDTGGSTSSSCSDLTGSTPGGDKKEAAKRNRSTPQTFKPISQADDEMLESGGMFTIEVSKLWSTPMEDDVYLYQSILRIKVGSSSMFCCHMCFKKTWNLLFKEGEIQLRKLLSYFWFHQLHKVITDQNLT